MYQVIMIFYQNPNTSVIMKFQMCVSSFKEKIADQVGVPVGQQRLIFRGKVLKDEHLLSEYRILQVYILNFP